MLFLLSFPKQRVHTEGFLRVGVKASAWSGCSIWARHFSYKFSHKIATCPSAFRLRRLANNLPREFSLILICGILLGSSAMSMCISTAQARTKRRPKFSGSSIFPVNSRIKLPSWDVHVNLECAGSRTVCGRDLAQGLLQLLVRRSCGDPCEMLSEAFAWSCTGPCAKVLQRSCWHPLGVFTWSGMQVFWRSCWNPPQEVIAVRSWRSSALLLVWKFCGCS